MAYTHALPDSLLLVLGDVEIKLNNLPDTEEGLKLLIHQIFLAHRGVPYEVHYLYESLANKLPKNGNN